MEKGNLSKGYDPKEIESRWYNYWVDSGLFRAEEKSDAKPYSIVIPPPNVTGVLHMGHSLNVTLQDILCRYRRLKGDNVLWIPGTDHAGIATQNVVERHLASKGISRHELGREAFIKAVWEWRKEYGNTIISQLKALGASCDWSRERFTMDEGLSRAVRKVFVQLYREGLIYKGNYIINWCPRCQTALADIEVEHEDVEGKLYHIFYPLKGSRKKGLVIATTRPETMLGDTAVAVHPKDKRYVDFHGAELDLPLTGRSIPVITDDYVDLAFGTGALKVTPAHDPNDFEIGRRHGLEEIKVIGEDGRMTEKAMKFSGLDRFECRKAVVDALTEEGLLVKIEKHVHGVGHCYRCHTVVEPNLSLQWFVKVKPLAEKAIDAVRNKKTKIIPNRWEKEYFQMMLNIRDWCISRQIWWGHQIPAWTCKSCGKIVVDDIDPDKCPDCGSVELERDPDVLDTWFSSALWPFSTMGWPEKTPLLETFYPTSVLVTGFDILFFWVARMMMMGLHFMGDVPFYDVYIHALVRDEYGKKMSKSTGNVVDPMELIDKYGTDALRFTLAAFAAQGRDIKLSEQRIEGYKHFINKLWNAARFAFIHINENSIHIDFDHISLFDRWILSRLRKVAKEVADAIDSYRFNDAAGAIYKFVWHEFCDWYLELVKPLLYSDGKENEKNSTTAVLYRVLRDILICLHPFIPFVTEEIWQRIPATKGSILKADYPIDDSSIQPISVDDDAEEQAGLIFDVISAIRNIRGEMRINPSMKLRATLKIKDQATRELFDQYRINIETLARLNSLSISEVGASSAGSATALVKDITIYVDLSGVIDFEKEIARLDKEIGSLEKDRARLEKKLANEDFRAKAPAEVVEKAEKQLAETTATIEKLQATRQTIKNIASC